MKRLAVLLAACAVAVSGCQVVEGNVVAKGHHLVCKPDATVPNPTKQRCTRAAQVKVRTSDGSTYWLTVSESKWKRIQVGDRMKGATE